MSPLTPQQDQVIALLMQGVKAVDAAAKVGVHRNTVSNWRRSCPEFQHAFADAQLEQSTYYRAQIANLGDSAIRELKSILKEPSSSLTLRAVVVILDRIIKPIPQPPLLPPIPEYLADAHEAPANPTDEAPKSGGNPENFGIPHNHAQSCTILRKRVHPETIPPILLHSSQFLCRCTNTIAITAVNASKSCRSSPTLRSPSTRNAEEARLKSSFPPPLSSSRAADGTSTTTAREAATAKPSPRQRPKRSLSPTPTRSPIPAQTRSRKRKPSPNRNRIHRPPAVRRQRHPHPPSPTSPSNSAHNRAGTSSDNQGLRGAARLNLPSAT